MKRVKPSKSALESVYEQYKEDPARCKREFKRLLARGVEAQDLHEVGEANYYLALLSYQQGQRGSLLSYAYKAAKLLEGTEDYDMASRSHNLLGIAYAGQENYLSALEAYNTALEIVRGHRRSQTRRNTLRNNIAECYCQMGQYQKGIRILRRCLASAMKQPDPEPKSQVIYGVNLADGYESAGDPARAEEVLDQVYPAAQQLKPGLISCAYYARRACVAYLLGKRVRASAWADQALTLMQGRTDSYELHRDFEKIARAAIAQGEFERAGRFVQILQNHARSSGHVLDDIMATRLMAAYQMALGDRDRALELYEKLNALYEQRIREEKALQYEMQQKSEANKRELRHLMERVRKSEEIADREPLTMLLNRLALIRVAGDFMAAARAGGRPLGGIFLDIDYFKEYNDTYGHAMGDEAIRQVARACLEEETAEVRFARYGGDEFFGIVLGQQEREVETIAIRIAARIREKAIPHAGNPREPLLTMSVGVVDVDMSDNDNTIIDVVSQSDKALYHAKNAGKNAIYVYHRAEEESEAYRRLDF